MEQQTYIILAIIAVVIIMALYPVDCDCSSDAESRAVQAAYLRYQMIPKSQMPNYIRIEGPQPHQVGLGVVPQRQYIEPPKVKQGVFGNF
jgi:hypothetical protein